MWLILLAALLPIVRSAYELDPQKLQGLAKAKVEVTLWVALVHRDVADGEESKMACNSDSSFFGNYSKCSILFIELYQNNEPFPVPLLKV